MILTCSVVMSLTINKNGAIDVTCLERVRMKGNCLIFLCPRESVNEPLSNRRNEVIFEVVISTLFSYRHKMTE